METVRERVSRVVAEQFLVDPTRVADTASIDDGLSATSLDRVELIMALEDEFDITIIDEEAAELHTLGDLMTCVRAHLPAASALPSQG
jgi:acyl carrier protein